MAGDVDASFGAYRMDNTMQRSDSVDQAASGVQHREANRIHVTVIVIHSTEGISTGDA
jgi:hypothetical protein